MDSAQQKSLFIELAELIRNAGSTYSDFMTEPASSTYLDRIIELEREGDEIEDELNEHFTTQRNIPYLALDRAKLLSHLDEVLDQLLIATKTLSAFSEGLPKDFTENAKTLADLVAEITRQLRDAVEIVYDNFDKATTICINIEKLRDQASATVFDLESLYFNGEESTWKTYTAVSRVLKRTMAIINSVKVSSEMIQLMSMKYL